MPKAGFCKECSENVYLEEDGSCPSGHPASAVKDIYETKPAEKKRTWLIVISIISLTLILLVGCAGALAFFYWRNINIEPSKEWTTVSRTDFSYKQENTGRMYFKMPKRDWLFSVNLKDFKMINDPGDWPSRLIYASNYKTGVFITVFAEPAYKPGSAKVCRYYYWKKQTSGEFNYEDVKFYEKGNFACVEAMLRESDGQKVNQKNIHVYIVKDGVWFDIHMSKAMYEPSDDKYFDKIINSIQFVRNGI